MGKVNSLFQDQQEHFEYLDQLRESGVTNMLGARPYLIKEFGLDRNTAGNVLQRWMATYSERQSSRDRQVMAIEIGKVYRHRDNPEIGFAKALEILPARKGENKSSCKVVKVQWSTDNRFEFGLIKYFKQSDLVKRG